MNKKAKQMVPMFIPISFLESVAWKPLVDIYRLVDGWLLKFELPGVEPEYVTIECDDSSVTVRGSRRDYCIETGCCHYQMEITYSQFERTIEIPDDLSAATWQAEFRLGLLLIRIRKDGNR